MNKLGVHGAVWVGSWSKADCAKAVAATAEVGYDFIEVPLLDPYGIDVADTRAQLEQAGLDLMASLGLDASTDISSGDPAIVARGEDLLDTAVSVVRDLGGSDLCGVIHCAMMKYMVPASEASRDSSADALRRVAGKAEAKGVRLHLEVVNRYESNLINTGAQAVEMLERIGAANMAVE